MRLACQESLNTLGDTLLGSRGGGFTHQRHRHLPIRSISIITCQSPFSLVDLIQTAAYINKKSIQSSFTMNCQTFTYATHKVPLKCDVYSSSPDYCSSSSSTTTPVFLFFHAGGLVGWARDCVPPWLVQVCVERKWPLISASYRFLPQAGAQGLLEDVAAAYEFAQRLGQKEGGEGDRRPVIVGGASAGTQNLVPCSPHLISSPRRREIS